MKNVSMPEGKIMSSNTSKLSEKIPEGFNMATFSGAKDIMKDGFPLMIQYFIEDTERYISQMEQGITTHNLQEVISATHTIKSSGRQIGADLLSEKSKEVELLARELLELESSDDAISELKPKIKYIRSEFTKINLFLNTALDDKAE